MEQRGAESTFTQDPKSWSKNKAETGNRAESYQVPCREQQDVATVGPRGAVDNTGSLHSSTISQFNPNYSAKDGSIVFNPVLSGSKVETFNNNIYINSNQPSQGSVTHDASSQPKNEKIAKCQQNLKKNLIMKFSRSLEGIPGMNKKPLENFYTELHIIEGGNGEVNKEHEVREMEADSMTEEEPIHFKQLFKPQQGQDIRFRTVVTRGITKIGKTVSTNKFILDWAEGRENTNLDFVFPVPFQDLNKMKNKTISLEELLTTLYSEIRGSEIFTLGEHKILFVLDGLNESHLPLDFNCEFVSDVTKPIPVADLLVNIIRGRLLPSALVWITTQPEAFKKIPSSHVDLVIEVRGFRNTQKEEYFGKKIRDPGQADRVISCVKSCKSLYIMCHIPGFCWMLVSELEKKLAKEHDKDTPQTMTLMYVKFLTSCVGDMMKKTGNPEPGRPRPTPESVKAEIISLGKLAFEWLNKDLSVFYECDLTQNGIKDTEPSMLSGLYTQIFRDDNPLFQEEKTFSFVHLSVQEFFAALYVYVMFNNNNNNNVLIEKSSSAESDDKPELNLFKAAVEKSLQCQKGHFDLFLRFLLGLSLESNQAPLQFVMTRNKSDPKTRAEIIEHIKERIGESPSSDRRRNLIHCLWELGDHSLRE